VIIVIFKLINMLKVKGIDCTNLKEENNNLLLKIAFRIVFDHPLQSISSEVKKITFTFF